MNHRKMITGIVMGLLFGIGVSLAASEIPPREETVLVSSWWGIPPGWNPLLPLIVWGRNIMYPSLFMYSFLQERWIPYLAEDFRWVDKFTLEVKLRPEAKWWDGVAITAYDVEFTWALGKRHMIPWLTPTWDFLAAVKAIDYRTVQFVANKEKLNYFALAVALVPMVLPRHRWEPIEAEYGARLAMDFRDDDPAKIIGGGPYKLAWWTADFWVYERVDDWWGKDIFGLPHPRYIGHRVFKDNPAANLAFEHLELDAMTHFTPAVWELWEVKKLPIRTYHPKSPFYIGGSVIVLGVNFARPPLNNPVVRRAIAHAIPFDDLIEMAYFGYSIRAHPSMIIHTSPAAEWIDHGLVEKYGYDFDLEKARKLLDEAGIIDRDGDGVREMPDGTRLGPWAIEVPFGWTDWMMMCDMIADNLRKIGMDVTPRFPDFGVWMVNAHKGEFDMIIIWTAGPGLDHPWNVFRVALDPRLTGPVGEVHPAGNFGRYINWDTVPLIDAIPAEANPDKLREYYSKLQEFVLRDVATIPLFYGAVWYIYAEHTWDGWPKAEYPDRWITGLFDDDWPSALPTLFGLVPAGEDPKLSAWETRMKPLVFPTAKIWEELGKVMK